MRLEKRAIVGCLSAYLIESQLAAIPDQSCFDAVRLREMIQTERETTEPRLFWVEEVIP